MPRKVTCFIGSTPLGKVRLLPFLSNESCECFLPWGHRWEADGFEFSLGERRPCGAFGRAYKFFAATGGNGEIVVASQPEDGFGKFTPGGDPFAGEMEDAFEFGASKDGG